MIISAHITNHHAFIHVKLKLSSEPQFIELEYNSAVDEDDFVIVTKSVNYYWEDGYAYFTEALLTNEPFIIRTDNDERIFDNPTKAYDVTFNVGIENGDWYIDNGKYLVLDELSIEVFLPIDRMVEWGEKGYDYSPDFYYKNLDDTRIFLSSVPNYSDLDIEKNEPVLFKIEGVREIYLYDEEESKDGKSGYGIYTGGQV